MCVSCPFSRSMMEVTIRKHDPLQRKLLLVVPALGRGCCSVPSVSITKMQERMEGRGDPKNTSIRKYRYKLTTGSTLNVAIFSPHVGKSSIHGSYRLYMPSLCQSRYLWLNLKISPIGHNRNPAGTKKTQPATKKQKHLLG